MLVSHTLRTFTRGRIELTRSPQAGQLGSASQPGAVPLPCTVVSPIRMGPDEQMPYV